MRVKGTLFLLDAGRLETVDDESLQLDDVRGAVLRTEPEDLRRTVGRKDTDPAEDHTKRRDRDLGTDEISDLAGARLVHFADEHERQMHLLGPHPCTGLLAKFPADTARLGCNRTARLLRQVDGDKQTHRSFNLSPYPLPSSR